MVLFEDRDFIYVIYKDDWQNKSYDKQECNEE
jgi:hypothetical protein